VNTDRNSHSTEEPIKMMPQSHPAASSGPWPAVQPEYKPWTRWWWLGSAVDEVNLTRELEELHAAGFGGVEITPIYGVKGTEARQVEFLSQRWLELVHHVCREAQRLGLGVDIIPGTGWRLGDAQVPLEERAVVLRLHREQSAQGVRYSAEAVPSGERVKRPAPGGAGHTIDMLDPHAVAHYVERFHARFFAQIPAQLVRAEFHDSWEYDTDWSRGLMDEFRARRGYDLQPYLEALDPESAGMPEDVAARVCYDYRLTVEEMLLENFARNWQTLCEGQGLLTRNQAHGSIGNLLDIYASVDIPETEIFGDRVDPLVHKFASSAGNVAGRQLISAESFTWLSDHWLTDLGKLKRYTDMLFICGINHIFYHGTAYSPDDALWPGWLFYASTQVNDRNPLWRDLPALNAYITRCQSLLQAGSAHNDVLVYWPIHDGYMGAEGRVHKFYIRGDDWTAGPSLKQTAQSLWDKGFLFDYVSDRQLQQASISEGRVQTPGGHYRAVVLPPLRFVPVETAQALLQLARAGVPIIYHGAHPDWDVPGLHALEQGRAALAGIVTDLAAEASFLATACPDSALGAVGVHPESFQEGTGLRCVRRRLENNDTLYFIVNTRPAPFDGWITPVTSSASATWLDPWTGRSGSAQVKADQGLRLQLGAHQSLLLILSENTHESPPWPYRTLQEELARDISGPWRIAFVAGGPTLPAARVRDTLLSITEFGDTELERFAGTVRYETTFDVDSDAAAGWAIDLGDVRHSARLFVNGQEIGIRVMTPYTFEIPVGTLQCGENRLVVEVTTLAANRIRDLDRRQVPWKIFDDINIVHDNYLPFDASTWDLVESGLLGPVRLMPVQVESFEEA